MEDDSEAVSSEKENTIRHATTTAKGSSAMIANDGGQAAHEPSPAPERV